jgi:hypothetical protein
MPPFHSKIASIVFEWCHPGTTSPPDLPHDPVLASQLFDFAARNGVAPWFYFQLNKKSDKGVHLSREIENKFRMQYLQTLVMNQQKWKVFGDMNFLAQQHGIKIIPLKGTALAFTLYPQESLRPMGDIDILLAEHQIEQFKEIMYRNGAQQLYAPISKLHAKVNAHIPAIRWQNIMIEPHQRLFGLGNPLNPDSVDLFTRTTHPPNQPEILIFDDIMQTYHLAAHTFKGYQMGGMRLGWLLDIALVLKRNVSDPAFINKVIAINPRSKKQIESAIYWSSLLLEDFPWHLHPPIPFPDEAIFHKEVDTEKKHKFIVLHEISRLPGVHKKILMLFREFFPEKAYMDHQYGRHRGFSLLKLYLRRISGL